MGLSPGADRDSGIMRNRPFEAVSSDRGLLGLWGMHERPRSRDSGSSGRLCMLRGAPERMGDATHSPGARRSKTDLPTTTTESATPSARRGGRARAGRGTAADRS